MWIGAVSAENQNIDARQVAGNRDPGSNFTSRVELFASL
jgi:hypothetical protein